MIKIVCDLLGADKNEKELVKGAVDAVNEIEDLGVVLCGKADEINEALATLNYNKEKIEIINATEEITNIDIPTRAFKSKPNSSLVLGLNKCVEDPEALGFVSCGSTGAVLVSSIFILGRLEGCRPALACVLKTQNNEPVCIVDCGANVDTKVDHLVGFAKLGVAYMQSIGIENPRVSLLSNGSEEKKGNELVKEAHQALKIEKFNFIGNIEGKDALSGKTDVIVCDGFAGNILLKTIEGAAKTVFTDLVHIAKKSSEHDSKVLMGAIQTLMAKYDYNTQGGAILLGVKTPVVKGHGAANSTTIYSIVKQAYGLAKNKLIDKTMDILA